MHREALSRGATIGILGGGQLGRMLAMAAAKLGFKPAVYAPAGDNPACQVTATVFEADYGDEAALDAFARTCDAVTFEFENVPVSALDRVARHTTVRPPATAAAIAQNRILEKKFLTDIGLDLAPYAVLRTVTDLTHGRQFLLNNGRCILKRATEGYDGKGQFSITTEHDLEAAFAQIASPCVLEARLDFQGEISVIAVRSAEGAVKCYDCPDNLHEHGVLRKSSVPSMFADILQTQAHGIAALIADRLQYVGVIGIELFVPHDQPHASLLVNEIAPRVHNTGHWTLDACCISQFENHIRAVAGWPLGSTQRHSDAVMTNLLGDEINHWPGALSQHPTAGLYLYGKSASSERRKVGHVTEITPRSQTGK